MKKGDLFRLVFFGFIASWFFLKFPERTIFASLPAPAPKCYIKGLIQGVRFEKAYENSCVKTNSCPTDMQLSYPDTYYLSVKIQNVSFKEGDTRFQNCDSLYPLESIQEIFVVKDKVKMSDSFSNGQIIDGLASSFWGKSFDSYQTMPSTKSIKQTYPTVYCGGITCNQGEYCYHEQTGESNCLSIKDNYCGGGGLENVYPIKQCNPPEYNCLPILLGSKEDLPRVCIKIFGGETKKAKIEIKEIPSNTGQSSYMIKTESVQVISKVKVEINEKDEIEVVADTKKIPNPVVILNPDGITDRLSNKPERVSLDVFCSQDDACKPVYEIDTKNTVKFLGIIPVSYTSTLTLDAITASQILQFRPWFIRSAPFLFR